MRALISQSRLARLPKRTRLKAYVYIRSVRYLSTCRDETFSVSIGNNGFVSLRYDSPEVTRPATTHCDVPSGSKVILYLPPGPIFQGSEGEKSVQNQSDHDVPLNPRRNLVLGLSGSDENSLQHALASMTSATVVTVNYRLGAADKETPLTRGTESQLESEKGPDSKCRTAEFYKYPTPVHDTLAGFDWIKNNLQPTKLGVFGSHIGGSLSLMLALTEPQLVHAVAAYEPICDWPGLDEYCTHEDNADQESSTKQKRSTRRKSAPADLVPLLEARERLFASFERCFDAFASPVLFLRSAGRDIPKTFPQYLTGPEYPIPVLKNTGKMTSEEYDSPTSSLWDRDMYPGSDTDGDIDPPVRRRKALSRWPPYGLDYGLNNEVWTGPDHGIGRLQVTLPWVRVFLGNRSAGSQVTSSSKGTAARSTVLEHQGEEIVSVMRKACFWGREKGFGERIVTLSREDDFPGQEVANYFQDVFNKESSDDD
ncbi:uncharacterized protein N7503_010300 [Penicillium pulvis]|uniref:uncharacterized protein n=1 Tax=Penicillium pulvis TaxID=1562058 RepID=UPI0025486357|nr:uncharacterized protein N7503_010300 [Penicillium pulvis]KAJ5785088.1 hypothetical protein N7503_010300 [Penicillium pulvis]